MNALRIIEITGTRVVDGDIVAEALIVGDDNVEDTIFTLPGFQSRPLNGSKFAMIQIGSGDYFFLGMPLAEGVNPGEARMFWTDANGVLKGEIFGKVDGTLTIMAKGNTSIDVTGNTNMKASGTTTIEATGLLTVKSAAQVTLDAPKIALRGTSAEAIAVIFDAFTALAAATDGFAGLPLSSAPDMATAVSKIATLKE